MLHTKLSFYRRSIMEMAARCNDADSLDFIYKLLADMVAEDPQDPVNSSRSETTGVVKLEPTTSEVRRAA